MMMLLHRFSHKKMENMKKTFKLYPIYLNKVKCVSNAHGTCYDDQEMYST